MSALTHLLPALPFLLTYAVHSTALLLGAWAGDALLGENRTAAREGLWRFALVGALLSSSLQVGLGIEPLTGSFELLSRAPVVTGGEPTTSPVSLAPLRESSLRSSGSRPSTPLPRREEVEGRATAPPAHPFASRSKDATALAPGQLEGALAVLWLLVTTALVLRLAAGHARLYRRLADREPVGGRLRSRLDELVAQAGMSTPVALTASARLSIPIALGLGKPEICLPRAALGRLDPAEQDAVLAHELAHLRRRDPQWLLLARLLEQLLFFQPLHRIARHRLEELAELRSDDWASSALGDGLGLARCLATVAGWQLSTTPGAATGLAARRSRLRRRIERLIGPSTEGEPMSLRHTSLWTILVVAVAVALATFAAPGVSLGPAAALKPPPSAPLPAAAPVAPLAPEGPHATRAPRAAPAASPTASPAPPSPALFAVVPQPAAAPAPQQAGSAPDEETVAEELETAEETERSLEQELATMEATMEEVERSLEEALAPLEGEIELQLKALETEIELELEPMLRELDEVLQESLQNDSSPSGLNERVQVVQDALVQLQPSIESAVESATRLLGPLQEEIMEAARAAHAIDRERLHELAQRMAETAELRGEERRALRDELRRLAEEGLPDAEELAAIAERARAAAEAARPTREQMEGLKVEIEEAAERLRERLSEELEEPEREGQEEP